MKKLLEEDKKPVRLEIWNEKEIDALNKHLLLTAKPIVYLVNLSEKDYVRKVNENSCKINFLRFISKHSKYSLY